MTRSIDAPIGGTRKRAAMSYEERCTRDWLEGKGLRPEEAILMEVEPAPVETPQPATNGHAPPDPWEGGERPQCVYFTKGKYEVRVGGKYVGIYPKLAEAVAARDKYKAEHSMRPWRANRQTPKPTAPTATNGTAPPKAEPATPAPPAASPSQLRVGDVATLRSGGEPMTVVGLGPDGVDLMTWSAGELTRLCLPRECVTKGE